MSVPAAMDEFSISGEPSTCTFSKSWPLVRNPSDLFSSNQFAYKPDITMLADRNGRLSVRIISFPIRIDVNSTFP